jgi:antirestriction protein ArdC
VSMTTKADSLHETLNASIESLAAETDSVKQDATFRTWLDSMSRFHRYSWGNQIRIAEQRRDATRVAGFHAWLKLGRFVKKGEKGISITAPIIRQRAKDETPAEGERMELTGKGPRRVGGFRGTTVFDVAQTDGEPLPEAPEHNATTGGETLLPMLEAAAAAFGIVVAYESIPGRAEGYSMGGRVVVEESQSLPAKCGTLAHEIAHELMHKTGDASTKQQRELEAEATAYVVLNHFGMSSGSRFYLHGYGITGEMLKASMQTIAATARRIIDQIEGASTEREGAEDDSALPIAA